MVCVKATNRIVQFGMFFRTPFIELRMTRTHIAFTVLSFSRFFFCFSQSHANKEILFLCQNDTEKKLKGIRHRMIANVNPFFFLQQEKRKKKKSRRAAKNNGCMRQYTAEDNENVTYQGKQSTDTHTYCTYLYTTYCVTLVKTARRQYIRSDSYCSLLSLLVVCFRLLF